MGTNYYVNFVDEKIHIGKSSSGWCFSLRLIPTRGIYSLEDWIDIFKSSTITDEYGQEISTYSMIDIIVDRQGTDFQKTRKVPMGFSSWEEFHLINESEFGPNGLVRFKIDGVNCIGHGDGTWDLLTGEFG